MGQTQRIRKKVYINETEPGNRFQSSFNRASFLFAILQKPKNNLYDTNNKKKPPIRYKKVVYLNDEFIDSDEQIKRIFTRKMLCWYVTGHWRNQATNNGHKRIFIQGYWKGVAREMKRSDIREREMVLKEE